MSGPENENSSRGPAKARSQVWAIGGGKGGTGKSFVTSSLGCYLASKGKRVVMLDADLGGANLHTFLGIKRPRRSLTEFFEKQTPLGELVVESGNGTPALITGDLQSIESGNIKYTQKLKLFRHIRALKADFVLIDLGSGSHSNVLDTFLLADRRIVVLVPEKTSIENMYHFAKNAFFRRLKMASAKVGLKESVGEIWKLRESHGIHNLKDFVDHLKGLSPKAKEFFTKEQENFKVEIVLNRIRTAREVQIGEAVKSAFKKVFGFESSYMGYVEYDDSVWQCVNSGRPFMSTYPFSNSAREIQRLAANLLASREMKPGR